MKSQIISAIAAVVSATGALIAICYQIQAKKDMDKEKIEFAKGIFYIIISSLENNILTLSIKNRGMYCVTDLSAKWQGNYSAEIDVKDLYWGDGPNKKEYDYEIILDFAEKSSYGPIEGNLTINYKDVYGNTKEVSKEIEILSKMDTFEEREYLEYNIVKLTDRLFR